MDTILDLSKFCVKDSERHGMNHPFTQNGKTWATNGWLAIGVPERADVPANDHAPDISRCHPTTPPEVWYDIPVVDVQPCKFCKGKIKDFTCPECNGRGVVNLANYYSEYNMDCNTCDGNGDVDECIHCAGTGYDSDKQTDIGNTTFNNRALMLIVDLPNVQIGPTGKTSPALIKFDGGEGFLMPANKLQ